MSGRETSMKSAPHFVVLYGPDPTQVRSIGPFTSSAAAYRAWEQMEGVEGAAFCSVIEVQTWRDVRAFFGITP